MPAHLELHGCHHDILGLLRMLSKQAGEALRTTPRRIRFVVEAADRGLAHARAATAVPVCSNGTHGILLRPSGG